jgi:hypothetical protein
MSEQQNDTGFKTFTAGAALEPFRRVKLDTTEGQVVYAGAGEAFIGVTQDRAASGSPITVKLKGLGTYQICCASSVAASGTAMYGAASGKVDDAVSGSIQGYVNGTVSGDGSIKEICLI